MPKGPQGQKRPADLVGAAVSVARIATGEASEQDKNASRRQAGIAGGRARAARLPENRRSEIARLAAKARWEDQ